MSCLPSHGRVSCNKCFKSKPVFNQTESIEGDWKITYNPLAWGNTEPEIVVLGFSKGPNAKTALKTKKHDEVAYDGGRQNVGKILAHIGLIDGCSTSDDFRHRIDELIAEKNGRFHFSSLIRCTVEQFDQKNGKWSASGGGMLDKFVATQFGAAVTQNCVEQFLSNLPASTKLIVMFGMGSKMNYVQASFNIFKQVIAGDWEKINDVAYTNGRLTVVHVEHFQSQGALIPNWLGINRHERSKIGFQAKEAVQKAMR